MAQTQSKPTPNLVSVDRSGRVPIAVRVADGVIESSRAEAIKPAPREESAGSDDGVFDGFVFEEAGALVASTPTRESSVQSLKRGPDSGQEPVGRVAPTVAAMTAAVAPVPKAAAHAPVAVVPVTAKKAEETQPAAEEPTKHPSVEPTALGPAGRGDLELRAKLNQKEAEMLVLRGELSARDRSLLELSNRSLEIERSRIDLSEQLEINTQVLKEATDKIRAQEADKEATAKRIESMRAGFRRNEDDWKRKSAAERESLKSAHATEVAELIAAHETKLEQLERKSAAEVERLHAVRMAAEGEASEKHSEAIKNAEAAHNKALSNAVSMYTKKVRALQQVQEKALADATASHAAAMEAALAGAASDKASIIAEAETAHRATQNELAVALTTVQFLERTQASQSERCARQEAHIATLVEALQRATEKADAAAETLATVRRALGAGLSLLNTPARKSEEG